MPSPRIAFPFAGLALLLVVAGCPDTEGQFNEHQERYNTLNPQTSTSTGVGGGCNAPMAGEADGNYFFVLAPNIAKTTPVVFDATVTTTAGANGGLDLTLELQALAAADRMTPVEAPFTLGPVPVNADGTFTWELGTVTLFAEANAITGTEVDVENLVLVGSMCAPAEFFCGNFSGMTSSGIALGGSSSFTFEKLENPGEYPVDAAITDCEGTTAPLPE